MQSTHRKATGLWRRAGTISAITLVLVGGVALVMRQRPGNPAGPLALARAAAAAPRVPDGCDLLPKSALEAILEEPLSAPQLRAGICEYHRATDAGARLRRPLVGVRLYRSMTKASFEAEVERTGALLGLEREPVTALGEEASKIGSAAIFAYARGAAVLVTRGDAAVDDAKAKEIAREAIAAVP